MIIAVDGPVAAGKGTLARRIAEKYGFHYLDTGALYRAVGLLMLKEGQDLSDVEAAANMAARVGEVSPEDPGLREESTGGAASIVANNSEVRAALLQYQRNFAHRKPGTVLDGRDIGTVVCPEAEVKLFITATAEIRARRRFDELIAKGNSVSYHDILADLKIRDARDQGRTTAPLKKAIDAHLLDTSKLDIEAALNAASVLIDNRLG
ncbi:(d)CMP kinase [Sneathiella marina]|uniref:Cytidylate kinase n=1 Tax=Sneathiella marina TaxID=2950108 RepID=A0ABY4W3P7_9PROT|nr:(d)CMP kinase [Sneathiella marina]USG61454.1 (d)CMP kinase [Sneathiella marina]